MRNKLIYALLICTLPLTSMAYIDPGSGSALMSAVIGFCVAVGMVVKTYWYKLVHFFKKMTKKQTEKN